jgi:ABC-2 type transport system ATP-binding protein
VRDVTKKFGDAHGRQRHRDAGAPGEIYGFLGPNGSGKTTFLRMLCGLLTPTAARAVASVLIFGANRGDQKTRRLHDANF